MYFHCINNFSNKTDKYLMILANCKIMCIKSWNISNWTTTWSSRFQFKHLYLVCIVVVTLHQNAHKNIFLNNSSFSTSIYNPQNTREVNKRDNSRHYSIVQLFSPKTPSYLKVFQNVYHHITFNVVVKSTKQPRCSDWQMEMNLCFYFLGFSQLNVLQYDLLKHLRE